MNKWLLALCFLCSIVFRTNAMLFKAEEFTLDNGLRCVIIENHKAPIVKHMIWYKTGSINEELDKSGSAHLLEHLMFRGTKFVKDGEFNTIMDKNGIQSNAFTGYDVTVYHEFSDISRLEVIMALEADRMQNLAFDEKAFLTEQKIVFQERKQVIENNPAAPFFERLRMMMYGGTMYSRPVSGSPEDILAMKAGDIMRLYHHFYVPNNALLVISGDIDVATAKPLIEKYYGSIPAMPIENGDPKYVTDNFKQRLQMALSGVTTAKLSMNCLLPPHRKLDKDIYALQVLADYLGKDDNSALYRDLVVEKKTAAYVDSFYNYTSRGNTAFTMSMIPATDNASAPEENMQMMRQSVERAVETLTEEKLEKTKRKMLSGLVYINDNPEDAAYLIGYGLSVGFTLDELQQYEDHINQVTIADIRKAYSLLQGSSCTDGILLPQISGDEKNNVQ